MTLPHFLKVRTAPEGQLEGKLEIFLALWRPSLCASKSIQLSKWHPRCAQTPFKSHSKCYKCDLDTTRCFKLVSVASKMAFGAPTRPPYSQNGLQLALQLPFQGRSGPSKSVVGSSKIIVFAFCAVEVLLVCPFTALRAFLDGFSGQLGVLVGLLGSTWSL